MAESSGTSRFRRIPVLLLFLLAIAASLLVFPNALLWMVACWLGVASRQMMRAGSGWPSLVACVAVVLVKRPDWSPAMVMLSVTLVTAAILFYWFGRRPARENSNPKIVRGAIAVVWIIWLAAIWESFESCHARRRPLLDPTQPIICVGDSLTTGLSANEAYPDYLRELVRVPVVNLGRAGVTARDMTKHLPEILEQLPQFVIIELGGHDFLRGYGREATRASLVQIIEACQQAGADVVLVEIPRGFITDPFSGLERELAREYDLELIADSAIRMLVVRSPAIPMVGEVSRPHWSDDGLHPNVAGARMLARVVYRTLRGVYGRPISAVRPGTLPADNR